MQDLASEFSKIFRTLTAGEGDLLPTQHAARPLARRGVHAPRCWDPYLGPPPSTFQPWLRPWWELSGGYSLQACKVLAAVVTAAVFDSETWVVIWRLCLRAVAVLRYRLNDVVRFDASAYSPPTWQFPSYLLSVCISVISIIAQTLYFLLFSFSFLQKKSITYARVIVTFYFMMKVVHEYTKK